MLMQNYLNENCFQERIFRLRVNEETFNVNIQQSFFDLFHFFSSLSILGRHNGSNNMSQHQ